MSTTSEFQCANCGRMFSKARSDEECLKEMVENFGPVPAAERVTICDECHWKIQAWLKTRQKLN